MATTLDEKQLIMLDALTAMGAGWHTRTDLAAYLHKNKLNPVEFVALDLLAERGVIEKELFPTARPHLKQWAYRIVDKGGDAGK